MTELAAKKTRAQRMAMPLAREVVKDLAVEHGACVRPIQLQTRGQAGYSSASGWPCG